VKVEPTTIRLAHEP